MSQERSETSPWHVQVDSEAAICRFACRIPWKVVNDKLWQSSTVPGGPMGARQTSWDASPSSPTASNLHQKRPLNDHNTAKSHAAHPSTPGKSSKWRRSPTGPVTHVTQKTAAQVFGRSHVCHVSLQRSTVGIVWYINYITCLHIPTNDPPSMFIYVLYLDLLIYLCHLPVQGVNAMALGCRPWLVRRESQRGLRATSWNVTASWACDARTLDVQESYRILQCILQPGNKFVPNIHKYHKFLRGCEKPSRW